MTHSKKVMDKMSEDKDAAEINGISKDMFVAWKHNPATIAVMKFMEDFADVMKKDHNQRWLDGSEQEDEREARGRILAIDEMRTLEFEHIEDFYREDDDETEDDKQD